MSLTGARLARERLRKLVALKAHPRRVDFYQHNTDLMVYMLASAGMETQAISALTTLTTNQVSYRLWVAEREAQAKAMQRKEFFTARKMYRRGISPVSKLIVAQITGKKSHVRKYVVDVLDKRGLYAPKASGVLYDDAKQVH